MSSFDDEERRAKYAVVPKSVNQGKVVKLAPKKLQTVKEVRTVLPEEQYLAKLEKIIVKDYFPELPKLMMLLKCANYSYVLGLQEEQIEGVLYFFYSTHLTFIILYFKRLMTSSQLFNV
uniref:Dynein light chain n=1 Tax=Heterorhabditis bacteriophora TaxID=37862 RepID=A0A1I7XS06_HETBA